MGEAGGFFGKVSSRGDFVERRLPSTFVRRWDNWLQQGMHGVRSKLGTNWLQSYLTSPLWRFAISSGVVDEQAWAGILMPSVDRVGRHFPLTLAAGTSGKAPLLAWQSEQKPWFDELEALALSTLGSDFDFEQFDAALQLHKPLPSSCIQSGPRSTAWCFSVQDSNAALETIHCAIADALLEGCSLWWTEGSPNITPCVLVCRGLPNANQTVAMQDGSWRQSDWQLPDLTA
jgi:type VI secretion system protein ImpM